jgi:hypothetical protein
MLGKPEGKHTCRREDNIKKEILKNWYKDSARSGERTVAGTSR